MADDTSHTDEESDAPQTPPVQTVRRKSITDSPADTPSYDVAPVDDAGETFEPPPAPHGKSSRHTVQRTPWPSDVPADIVDADEAGLITDVEAPEKPVQDAPPVSARSTRQGVQRVPETDRAHYDQPFSTEETPAVSDAPGRSVQRSQEAPAQPEETRDYP